MLLSKCNEKIFSEIDLEKTLKEYPEFHPKTVLVSSAQFVWWKCNQQTCGHHSWKTH